MTVNEIRALYKNADREAVLSAYREAELDATNPYQADESLLHLACAMADCDAVALLLERGINPNVRNRYGQTPLFSLAALDDRYQPFPEESVRRCADLLLDAKANVLRKDEDLGQTPITLAGQHGRFELLQSAAAHGVKLTATDRDGNNALHLACKYVRHDLSSLQYARSEEEKTNGNRRIEQFYKSVQALLEGGLDPDDKNDANQSAIDLAAESNANSITLLLKGMEACDPDSAQTKTGGMDLLQAVIANEPEAIRANAELGADLNSLADDNEKFKGMTPLAIACYTLELPTVQCLLALGADPNFKDADGRTAIAKWFLYSGDFYLNMQKAINGVPEKILQALLESGMDKDSVINDKSDTPLLGACKVAGSGRCYNNYRMGRALAQTLLTAGCNPSCANLEGITPLMQLCTQSDEGIPGLVCDLLDAQADMDAVDGNGNTALHYAARNSTTNAGRALAELLFDYGFAQAQAVNNDGKSALELAAEQNNEPLVKLILTNL